MAFRFETQYLELEIYRLITIVEASPTLAGFEGAGSDERGLDRLRRQLDFPEISRIVVTLAAIIRSSLDADPAGGGDSSYRAALSRRVGTLVPDRAKPQEQPLLFWDACNKVIHAKAVEPEPILPSSGPAPPLTGRLVLYGDRNGKDWRADLDLKEYALSALELTP